VLLKYSYPSKLCCVVTAIRNITWNYSGSKGVISSDKKIPTQLSEPESVAGYTTVAPETKKPWKVSGSAKAQKSFQTSLTKVSEKFFLWSVKSKVD